MTLQRRKLDEGNEDGAVKRAPAPAWLGWLETAALVAAGVAVGAFVDRGDPFLLRRSFSWLALAPLLAGLKHGSTRGLGAAAIQAVGLAIAWRAGMTQVPGSPAEAVLGWLLAGLAAGEFRDSWLRRIEQLEAIGDHLRGRVESLGRAYLALKISHDRLQGSAASASPTLRDAISAFRRDLGDRRGEAALEACGERILALFCDQAFVRAATLHPVDRKGRPGPAIAELGAAADARGDPLVCRAARTGLTVSVRDGDGSVLVAVPLLDRLCRVHGVVAVQDMPFLALHAGTLELLALLGGSVGEATARAGAAAPPIRAPEPPPAPVVPAPQVAVLPAPAAGIEEVA